jgi:serine/threonine protein kinase
MSDTRDSASLESIVRQIVSRWRAGEPPDAAAVLARHPELRFRKSLAIDLIYEEYCLRREQGETFVPSTFASRFPSYQQSLARMLDVHQFLEECPELKAPPWPKPGEVFRGFELVELIGAGAVARVFLAREIDVGQRRVVLKLSQFGRGEAQLLGKVEHPHVVPIYSVHEDELTGMTAICMPFLGTATLVDLLDASLAAGRRPESAEVICRTALDYLPPGVEPSSFKAIDPFFGGATFVEGIVYLMRQIASALAKAHQAGIMHRDIKPSNVLLARDGRAMLLDFNLSTDVRMPIERIGGTLAYMAPERIAALASGECQEDLRQIDPRSDLYSVGAMMYELLTGQLPSKPAAAPDRQPSLEEWLECRLSFPRPARESNRQVEPALDEILRRCLAPSAADRFGTAQELEGALGRLLAPPLRLKRKVQRHRRAVLAAGAALAATAAAGAGYYLRLAPYPQRQFERGLRAFADGDAAKALELFKHAMELGYDKMLCRFARGQANRKLGQYQLAIDEYLFCVRPDKEGQIFQHQALVKVFVGQAALQLPKYPLAQQFFKEARNEGWNQRGVIQNLAVAYAAAGLIQPACTEFAKLLARFPGDEATLYNRALCWAHWARLMNRAPENYVLQDVDRLARAHPQDVEIGCLSAFVYVLAARNDERLKEKAKSLIDRVSRQVLPPEQVAELRILLEGTAHPNTGYPVFARWRPAIIPDSPDLIECRRQLLQQERVS